MSRWHRPRRAHAPTVALILALGIALSHAVGCARGVGYRSTYGYAEYGAGGEGTDAYAAPSSGDIDLTSSLGPAEPRREAEYDEGELDLERSSSATTVEAIDAAPMYEPPSPSGGGSGSIEISLESSSGVAYEPTPAERAAAEAAERARISDGERARLAEATTRASDGTTTAETTATDATSAPLVVYTAGFHVGVYQVREAQERIATTARELGGLIASQTDDTIVIRIPAARFFEAVDRVTGTGDVLHRDVRSTDVSEEFRDNEVRVRNLEAMRVRLEEMLRRASDVSDALAIERELERVTVELERIRGRQRYLSDRIALSTIAVTFRSLSLDPIEDAEFFVLPFEWLRNLGLPALLSVE